jgi:alkanesulfonate monooxygenase SsuD/methylene tetrahydromethanopterin reductase-like flavin-dependent oxidoreductase (luciferase family)
MSSDRPLKVGVQVPEVEREVRWPEMADIAKTIEDTGFDSLWVGDHLLYRTDDGPSGPWEAWSILAGVAAITERVEIGPLVASTSFHSPAMLAKKAATVDEISGGRLILGLGAGWNRTEYDAFGFPYDRRVSRFEEAFIIIRTLLTDGAIDFEGEFHTARDCELVPRPDRTVPMMVGSEGPRMLAATLPSVSMWNGWHAWYGNTIDGASDLIAKIDRAIVAAGRHPGDIDKTLGVLVGAPGGSGRRHGSPGRASSEPKRGSPAEIADHLRQLADLGIAHVQLVVDPITLDSINWLGAVLEDLDG